MEPAGHFQVGDWEVHPALNEVQNGGEVRHLELKVMDVLCYLARHSGEVLTKERLIQAIWPDTFVTDDALKYAIVSLRKALEDDARDPRYICTIPRRGYQLVAVVQFPERDHSPEEWTQKKRRSNRIWVVGLAAVLVLLVAETWVLIQFSPDDAAYPPPINVQVTTSIGDEQYPSLSPDGLFVAFNGREGDQDDWDIYVKEIGGPGLIQLTNNPADDIRPLWSPDGRQILFQRREGDRRVFLLKSPLGGEEKRVTAFPAGESSFSSRGVSWSPDGRRLALALKSKDEPLSIWELSLDSLNTAQVTHPPTGTYGDNDPAYSPDGRKLAFVRRQEWRQSTVYVLSLSGGDRQPVTDFGYPNQPAWTSDSRAIVFSALMESAESSPRCVCL